MSNSPMLKQSQTRGSKNNEQFYFMNCMKKISSQENLFSDPVSQKCNSKKQQYYPYLPMIYIWNFCNKMNSLVEHLTMFIMPVFNMEIGIKGISDCFSFVIQRNCQFKNSSYMVSYLTLAVFLYFINCNQKEKSSISQLINQSVQIFTKKKTKLENNVGKF